jgi:FtsJ-like methyltransferase
VLQFSFDTLKVGGHFVCKFYQGAEDKALEKSLKRLFHKVHREKPESSRSVWLISFRLWHIILIRLIGIERIVLCGYQKTR